MIAPEVLTAPSTIEFVEALRVKAPALAEDSNETLIEAAHEAAGLAYAERYGEAWAAVAALGVGEYEQRHLLRRRSRR